MLSKIFRNPIDVWPALLVTGLFAILLLLYLYVDSLWLMAACSFLLLLPRLSVVGYNHNHVHTMTFKSTMLNRLLEVIMFFETGTSPHSGTLNHIIGHHACYFNPAIDTLNTRRADGSTLGRHEFSFRSALWHYPSCITFSRGKRELRTKFIAHLAVCLILLGAVVAYKPAAAAIVFVVPMLIMLYMLKWSAWAHHSGLPMGDDFTASRTHTGKFYNWLTWNAGYHAAHHFRQATHWSMLPTYHAELSDRIAADLQGHGWGTRFPPSNMRAG
ncbi:fatty acid desaturase [Ramlibacter sp.]|uniref:fatty acid desaturase n=1 Tax=Ramlibacter sp. TaxID=1917967 RepID=UPI0017A86E20|nr:fatty acid desaturase [Ramlibacter sp.]MBA2676600.1 fatty acid desaturase [Ramlibacter sp.]